MSSVEVMKTENLGNVRRLWEKKPMNRRLEAVLPLESLLSRAVGQSQSVPAWRCSTGER
jgi:hypothetical protein